MGEVKNIYFTCLKSHISCQTKCRPRCFARSPAPFSVWLWPLPWLLSSLPLFHVAPCLTILEPSPTLATRLRRRKRRRKRSILTNCRPSNWKSFTRRRNKMPRRERKRRMIERPLFYSKPLQRETDNDDLCFIERSFYFLIWQSERF